MALFLIRRDMDADVSEEELDSAGLRAFCFTFAYKDMRWVTSYWDTARSRFYCVYEAESEEQLREHAKRARIPCDDVMLISQVGPEKYFGDVGMDEALRQVAMMES